MKKMKFLSLLLAAAMTVSFLFAWAPSASAAEDINIDANAVYLVEKTTGKVLYAKNENEKIYPASTTKLITILIALRAIDAGTVSATDTVTIPNDAYFDLTDDASSAGLVVGSQLSLEDLFYCALLPSANEACNTIAEYIAGDIPSFITMMNNTAEELGCTGTHFANAHGLPNDDHYTTAHDLYLIYNAISQYPLFLQISGTAKYTIPANSTHEAIELENTNELLDKDGKYYYQNCTAGKTGYTDDAGYCLVSSATDPDTQLSLIAVVMGAQSATDTDGSTLEKSFSETIRLYQWGFANFSFREVLSTDKLLAQVPVSMGDGADAVVLCPATPVTALADNSLTDSDFTYDVTVYSEQSGETVRAPVSVGDVLGEVTISLDGEPLGTAKLVASTGVPLDKVAYIKYEISKTVSSTPVRIIFLLIVLMFGVYIVFVIRYNRIRKERHRLAVQKAREEALNYRRVMTSDKSFDEIENLLKDKDNTTIHR